MIEPKPADLEEYSISMLRNCIYDTVMKINAADEEGRRLVRHCDLLSMHYYNRLGRDADQTQVPIHG